MGSGDAKSDDNKDREVKQQTEDDFETVNHEDAPTPGTNGGAGSGAASGASTMEDLQLTRFDNDLREEEDDSDDDDAMAHHPIFGMLAGRLGQRRRGSTHKYDKLHPENQVLTRNNIDDCVAVENSAFPEHERCSREKVCQDPMFLVQAMSSDPTTVRLSTISVSRTQSRHFQSAHQGRS